MFGTSSVSKAISEFGDFGLMSGRGEKTRMRTRTSSVLVANVFFVFLKSTSVDVGTFRRDVDDRKLCRAGAKGSVNLSSC